MKVNALESIVLVYNNLSLPIQLFTFLNRIRRERGRYIGRYVERGEDVGRGGTVGRGETVGRGRRCPCVGLCRAGRGRRYGEERAVLYIMHNHYVTRGL